MDFGIILVMDLFQRWVKAERTKQMEQILRAKVKIFFKSEN